MQSRSLKNIARTAIVSSLVALGSPIWAEPILIDNPSFELDVLPDGGVRNTITGWDTSLGGGDGVFHPNASHYPGGVVPNGENVAYANAPGNRIRQTLSALLEPGLTYALEVEVGNRLDIPFAGYIVQLRAAGNILAEDDSSQMPEPGEFVTATVTYTAPFDSPDLGQPLEIWMSAPGVQANYDNVRLVAIENPPTVAVPTLPAYGLMTLVVLIAVAGLFRLGHLP